MSKSTAELKAEAHARQEAAMAAFRAANPDKVKELAEGETSYVKMIDKSVYAVMARTETKPAEKQRKRNKKAEFAKKRAELRKRVKKVVKGKTKAKADDDKESSYARGAIGYEHLCNLDHFKSI